MIRKLRKKLMLVLMCVMCAFLAAILLSMHFNTRNSYEDLRQNAMAVPAQEAVRADGSRPAPSVRPPVAVASVAEDGSITVSKNELYYITDQELSALVAGLEQTGEDAGTASEYQMRYRRHRRAGESTYFFADTQIERKSLQNQTLFSIFIGLCAVALFFVASFFLARWMVKPVERVWEKQQQFISDASHELKTPLTVILSNTDMLLASGAAADEKNSKRLDHIRAESQRMKELVEGLLFLARSDEGAQKLERAPLNLSFLVTSATLTMESAIFDTGRTLDMDVQDGLTIYGSEERLHQLVTILLDNASKYSDPATTIAVRLCAQGRDAVLTVRSAGEPLSPGDCINIFERFYRLDHSRGRQQGYGLGLSIAHSIAASHGGSIEARSDGLRTNEFIVRLPCAPEA